MINENVVKSVLPSLDREDTSVTYMIIKQIEEVMNDRKEITKMWEEKSKQGSPLNNRVKLNTLLTQFTSLILPPPGTEDDIKALMVKIGKLLHAVNIKVFIICDKDKVEEYNTQEVPAVDTETEYSKPTDVVLYLSSTGKVPLAFKGIVEKRALQFIPSVIKLNNIPWHS